MDIGEVVLKSLATRALAYICPYACDTIARLAVAASLHVGVEIANQTRFNRRGRERKKIFPPPWSLFSRTNKSQKCYAATAPSGASSALPISTMPTMHSELTVSPKVLRPDVDEAFWQLTPDGTGTKKDADDDASEPDAGDEEQSKLTQDSIDAMKLPQLKAELQARGLSAQGKKAELAARLSKAISV